MIRTEREKTREVRKLNVLAQFSEGETLWTNQIATRVDIVWQMADRLLQQLVQEGRLMGDKMKGYTLYREPTIWERLKSTLHVKSNR